MNAALSCAGFFVNVVPVKLQPFKRVPLFVAVGVIAVVWLLRLLKISSVEELEDKSYDWRVRFATRFPAPVATNLGFVFIQDESIKAVNKGLLGPSFGLYWPRHVYARAVRQLSTQGVKTLGFDVLFAEPRRDHDAQPVETNQFPDALDFLAQIHPAEEQIVSSGKVFVESDDYLAWQLKKSGNVILAAEQDVLPFSLLRTNAASIADISTERDSDGVLRRARAFSNYRKWNRAFQSVARQMDLDLNNAIVERDKIILKTPDGQSVTNKLDKEGNFDLADFVGDKIPAGWKRYDKPFTLERVWHMGIVLAAKELKLDLDNASVDLRHGKIVLRGRGNIERTIPVDANGFFYVDWRMKSDDARLFTQPIEALLAEDVAMLDGTSPETNKPWKNKIAIIGSIATGNDLTDRGATPLEKDTPLVTKHWNVASSVITGKFIHRTSLFADLMLILLLGALTAILTWQMRALTGLAAVIAAALSYVALCFWVFVQFRVWLPVFLPVFGSMLVTKVLLVAWRVVFEQAEKRHVKNIFSKVVSPNVVHELLKAEKLSLGGARREMSFLFADIRGFTELTDASRDKAAAYIAQQNIVGAAAEAIYEQHARETLRTVNEYLALVADMVKKHNGTVDKYIGDCVMAFWGAPAPDPKHAIQCVRAALEAQQAIARLNEKRVAENIERELENIRRAAQFLPPLPIFPVLQLGSGINSGIATVGLMGSDTHTFNYTVFGREVNIAARLETVSGRGRIVVSESTFLEIKRDDPDLAARCTPLEPVTIKGIHEAVKIYEVPWRESYEPTEVTQFITRKQAMSKD